MRSKIMGMSLAFSLSVLCLGTTHAADSGFFNPVPIVLKTQASGGVPVGTVVAWPVAGQPADADNWLDCDGRSTAGYPELASVVGANVPNYQGLFLRGYGSQTHIKNNGTNVGNTATVHSSGALGAIQGDAERWLSGQIGQMQAEARGLETQIGVLQEYYHLYSSMVGGTRPGILSDIGFNNALMVPVANEIRPVNMAVRYLIRAKS